MATPIQPVTVDTPRQSAGSATVHPRKFLSLLADAVDGASAAMTQVNRSTAKSAHAVKASSNQKAGAEPSADNASENEKVSKEKGQPDSVATAVLSLVPQIASATVVAAITTVSPDHESSTSAGTTAVHESSSSAAATTAVPYSVQGTNHALVANVPGARADTSPWKLAKGASDPVAPPIPKEGALREDQLTPVSASEPGVSQDVDQRPEASAPTVEKRTVDSTERATKLIPAGWHTAVVTLQSSAGPSAVQTCHDTAQHQTAPTSEGVMNVLSAEGKQGESAAPAETSLETQAAKTAKSTGAISLASPHRESLRVGTYRTETYHPQIRQVEVAPVRGESISRQVDSPGAHGSHVQSNALQAELGETIVRVENKNRKQMQSLPTQAGQAQVQASKDSGQSIDEAAGRVDSTDLPTASPTPSKTGEAQSAVASPDVVPADKRENPAQRKSDRLVTEEQASGPGTNNAAEKKGAAPVSNGSALIVESNHPQPRAQSTAVPEPRTDVESSTRTSMLRADTHRAQATSLIESAQILRNLGKGEIRIALQTADAGQIKVHAFVHDGRLQADLAIERPELRNLVAADLPVLEKSLGQQNVHVTRISVVDTGTGGMTGDGHSHGRHERPQPPLAADHAGSHFPVIDVTPADSFLDARTTLSVHA